MLLAFDWPVYPRWSWTMPLDARPLKPTPSPQSSRRILRGPICDEPSNEKPPAVEAGGFALSRFLPEI
jgi:hypothetical protein